MFCDRCQRYVIQAATRLHDLGHTLNDLGAAMTQPNPDQATVDSVTAALNTAFVTVQSQVQSNDVAPLDLTAMVSAAQQYVDLAGPVQAPVVDPVNPA